MGAGRQRIRGLELGYFERGRRWRWLLWWWRRWVVWELCGGRRELLCVCGCYVVLARVQPPCNQRLRNPHQLRRPRRLGLANAHGAVHAIAHAIAHAHGAVHAIAHAYGAVYAFHYSHGARYAIPNERPIWWH